MSWLGKEIVDNVNELFGAIRGKYDLECVNYDGLDVTIGVKKRIKKEDFERLNPYFESVKEEDGAWKFRIEDVMEDVRTIFGCGVPSPATKVLKVAYQSQRVGSMPFISAYDNGILRFFYSMISKEKASEILNKIAVELYGLSKP